MKKCFVCAFALALALGVSASAFAKDGLSFGFGIGFKDNPSSLDGTVNHDGLAGTGAAPDSTIGNRSLYSTANLETMKKNGLISSFEDTGTMKSVDFAVNARYDFMDFMFVRLGFDYNMSLIGGDKSWKYAAGAGHVGAADASDMVADPSTGATVGNVVALLTVLGHASASLEANNTFAITMLTLQGLAQANPTTVGAWLTQLGNGNIGNGIGVAAGAGALAAGFGNPNDLGMAVKFNSAGPAAGAKAVQNWSYNSWAIPLTFGFNMPINDGKYNVYTGIGLVYASGSWKVEGDMPANAFFSINEVQTQIAAWAITAAGTAGATGSNPGAVGGLNAATGTTANSSVNVCSAGKETFEFSSSSLGINWLIGVDAEVAPQMSVFFEVETQMVAAMSDSHKKTILGLGGLGPDKYVTYTNIPGGQIFRIGGKYTLGQVF